MNHKMTVYMLGKILGIEGVVIFLPAIVALIYREDSYMHFVIPGVILILVHILFGRKKPKNTKLYGRDGLVIVALSWLLWSLIGAIPFYTSGAIPQFIDAFFETVSGFTTTGSTILTDIEALPKGMAFWRSLTHWIGGMGVLVFVMVITSLENDRSMHLMKAEMPGPEIEKLVPKARTTAQILYAMYFVLTFAEVIFLLFGGMNLYDSILHAFSTAGTGGFSNRNASIAYYDSAYIDGVITVFMILFGINFNMYFLVILKRFRNIWENEEVKAYFGIILTAIVMITINISNYYGGFLKAFRYASFQVSSIITTTGFITADFNQWPEFSKAILLLLIMIGACAGSTGGGMKVSRILILMKHAKREIKKLIHPKSVSIITLNKKRLQDETVNGVIGYTVIYFLIMVVSILIVSLNNFDFATTFSSVLTTLNNTGPGIAGVGPVENFSSFSALSKLVFCFDMLAGRLELFPFLMLMAPSVWRKKF